MILIAHRGNTIGPDPANENSPAHVNRAMAAGFDVEVDVWHCGADFWLGHDLPIYDVGAEFLRSPGLWCHAKNVLTLAKLVELGIHCFFHDGDAVVLTSKKFLWTLPGGLLTKRSICVLPEKSGQEVLDCAGVCSDFVALRRS